MKASAFRKILFGFLSMGPLFAPAPVRAQALRGTDVTGFFGTALGFPSISQLAREEVGSIPGITLGDGSNSKWVTGGGVAFPVVSNLYVTGELAWNRLGSMDMRSRTNSAAAATLKMDLLDINGGVQYRFPANSKVMPYVTGGAGIVRASVGVSGSAVPPGITVSGTDLGVNGGGGLYLFFGKRWGIRPEIKMVRIPDETFARASVGIFYQFGE
jgi:opacity protein-like surface antigen